MTAQDRWHFSGDVNLEYGGAFIDLATWGDGYCSAVRVTDLDSGCGFRGAVLIEHVVINGTDDAKRIREALRSCGGASWLAEIGRRGYKPRPAAERKEALRHAIADALMNYGYSDPDDCWQGSYSPHSEVVQLDPEGPMRFEGWKADKRLRDADLKAYVESVHLRD